MARSGIKIIVETPGLKKVTEALLKIFDDIEESAFDPLRAIGYQTGQAVCDAIQSGENLDGEPLKEISRNTVRRRSKNKGRKTKDRDRRPLIDTGELSDITRWRVNVRRSKKGEMSVTAKPSEARDRVFAWLEGKGFKRVYGVDSSMIRVLDYMATKVMNDAMTKFGRRISG